MAKVSRKKRKFRIRKDRKRAGKLSRLRRLYKKAKGHSEKKEIEKKLIEVNPMLDPQKYLEK